MASQEEIRSRVEFCLQLLNQGIDVSTVVVLTQDEYDVSQRTAYRLVKAAEEVKENEEDAPAECESTPEGRMESLIKLAELRAMRAIQGGSEKELTAAVKALDILKKQSGYALQMQKGAATDIPFAVRRVFSEEEV